MLFTHPQGFLQMIMQILIVKQLLKHMSPLSNTSSFQYGELCDNEYDVCKSFHSDEEPTNI